MVPLTRKVLVDISGAPEERITDELVKALNRTMVGFGISTIQRQAHFLAQLVHESGAFRYTEEIASGVDYEGRLDLGNTEPGDGVRYKGRGYCQVTGRANYTQYAIAVGYDVVAEPDQLTRLPHAATSAGWFWKTRGLNELADEGDVRKVTRRINGGYNGLAERIALTEKAIRILTAHRERIVTKGAVNQKVDPLPPAPLPVHLPDPPNHLQSPPVPQVVSNALPQKRPKWIGFSKVTLGVAITLFGVFGVHIPYAKEILANWEAIFTALTTIIGAATAIYGRLKADRPVTMLPNKPTTVDPPK